MEGFSTKDRHDSVSRTLWNSSDLFKHFFLAKLKVLSAFVMSVGDFRRPPVHRDSTSTISSKAALEEFNNNFGLLNGQRSTKFEHLLPQNLLTKHQTQFSFNSSSDIKIGEHVTNVYYNILSKVKIFLCSLFKD